MLALWLPLINNLNNQGLDDAVITNNGATVDASGKIGSCYSFNGSNSFIGIDDSNLYNIIQGGDKPFTIMFWIYHADSTRGVIFGDYRLSGYINFNIELTASHQIRFYWNGGPDKIFTDTTAEINTWVHIVLTYDGSKICIYKNGSLQTDTYASSLIKLTKTSGLFYLGRDSRTGATALNGRINDFRIYDTALSPREVKEISKGLVLHYSLSLGGGENLLPVTKFRNISYGPDNITQDGWITDSTPTSDARAWGYAQGNWNVDLDAGEYILSWDVETPVTASVNQGIGVYAENGDVVFSIFGTSVFGTTGMHSKVFTITESGSYGFIMKIYEGKVRFKLEKGNKNTCWIPAISDPVYSAMGYDDPIEYDVSGYGNNATKVGTITASSDTPRYSTSSSFDGSSYIINNTSTIHLSNEFTIAWWGKVNSWQKKWEGMFLLQNTPALNAASGTFSICNALHASIANKMALTIRQGGTTNPFDHYNWTYTIDEWAHYALTYNKGTIIMYQNGKSVYTSSIEDTSSMDYYYAIGRRGQKSDCQMSDFRIYNTALSPEDIQSLYHTPITLSNNGTLLTQGELSEV